MFLYRLGCLLFFTVIFQVSIKSYADFLPSDTNKKPIQTYGISYFSWNEKLTLKNVNQTEISSAIFNGFHLQIERDFPVRWYYRYGAQVFLGQAQAGNTQQKTISYLAANQSFWGLGWFYHLSFRQTSQTLLSFGPMILYRNLQWPKATSNVSVSSGSEFNFGFDVDFKYRLSRRIEVQHSLGSLLIDGGTYYKLGLNLEL